MEAVRQHRPDMLKKLKVHLMLHLVECMEQFGPTSAFNSERYDNDNHDSFVRNRCNVGSRHSTPIYELRIFLATKVPQVVILPNILLLLNS